MTNADSALVLFSGGQDSTTCLAWALMRYGRVETAGFDYGQRHRVELDCRTVIFNRIRGEFPEWAEPLGDDHIINTGFLSTLGETAMTHEVEIATTDAGLPSTFVPGRNLTFLTAAAGLAYRRGISVLVGGMCETDYSGYPDCRRETMDALEKSLSLGLDQSITIETPLMDMDKAAAWALAQDLGGDALIDLIVEHTHTCYRGDRDHRHTWGYGCGACPACDLRANGYKRFREAHTP
jgi:7-cyano-7-deazaguanine synthase